MITANGSTNYAFLFVKSYINGTATVANNYLDPRGLAYGVLVDNSNISGPFNGNIVTSNDVNMVTGAYIYPPTGGTGGTGTVHHRRSRHSRPTATWLATILPMTTS